MCAKWLRFFAFSHQVGLRALQERAPPVERVNTVNGGAWQVKLVDGREPKQEGTLLQKWLQRGSGVKRSLYGLEPRAVKRSKVTHDAQNATTSSHTNHEPANGAQTLQPTPPSQNIPPPQHSPLATRQQATKAALEVSKAKENSAPILHNPLQHAASNEAASPPEVSTAEKSVTQQERRAWLHVEGTSTNEKTYICR